ncbi:MAG TPA: rRNA adenine N(6)-methyltransferase family protein [Dehalococcoidia bacterium]|nr:rRNA adenine N(6)-methyltransferase family protein [Dehalococcoidia bacterium]
MPRLLFSSLRTRAAWRLQRLEVWDASRASSWGIERRPELSQHFLRHGAAAALVRRLGYPRGSLVVEAGAGDGALTAALLSGGLRVVAVERDARLYARLVARLGRDARLTCVLADFLTVALPAEPYRVVSNAPYGVTAALARKLLEAARPPEEAVLVVQREAAEKFAGVPRTTLFSLLHAPWSEITIAGTVRRRDFVPAPRVRSAILRIRQRPTALIDEASAGRYRALVRAAFGNGSGDVSRALRGHATAAQVRRLGRDLGFEPHAGPGRLTFGQWLAVFRFVEHECLGHDPTWRVAA